MRPLLLFSELLCFAVVVVVVAGYCFSSSIVIVHSIVLVAVLLLLARLRQIGRARTREIRSVTHKKHASGVTCPLQRQHGPNARCRAGDRSLQSGWRQHLTGGGDHRSTAHCKEAARDALADGAQDNALSCVLAHLRLYDCVKPCPAPCALFCERILRSTILLFFMFLVAGHPTLLC